MVELNSVGSVIDIRTGIVYPMLDDGGYDKGMGTYLEDCCDEWIESLSENDWNLLRWVEVMMPVMMRN